MRGKVFCPNRSGGKAPITGITERTRFGHFALSGRHRRRDSPCGKSRNCYGPGSAPGRARRWRLSSMRAWRRYAGKSRNCGISNAPCAGWRTLAGTPPASGPDAAAFLQAGPGGNRRPSNRPGGRDRLVAKQPNRGAHPCRRRRGGQKSSQTTRPGGGLEQLGGNSRVPQQVVLFHYSHRLESTLRSGVGRGTLLFDPRRVGGPTPPAESGDGKNVFPLYRPGHAGAGPRGRGPGQIRRSAGLDLAGPGENFRAGRINRANILGNHAINRDQYSFLPVADLMPELAFGFQRKKHQLNHHLENHDPFHS